MNKKEILENNKLVALFMGADFLFRNGNKYDQLFWWHDKNNTTICLNNLDYHKNWNRLMSVVEKISKDKNVLDIGITFNLGCDIYFKDLEINEVPNCWTEFEETMIDCVYQSCIKFIKWQRKRKKTKN